LDREVRDVTRIPRSVLGPVPGISFGINPNAYASYIWIVERSTDLKIYTELARVIDGEVILPEPTFAVTTELTEGIFTLTD